MPDDVPEVVLAETALDAVAEDGSASDVWRGTFGVGAYALAAVAAKLAREGGGGGGGSLPEEWTVAADGSLTIESTDPSANNVLTLRSPSTASDSYQVLKIVNDDDVELVSLYADGVFELHGGNGDTSLTVSTGGNFTVSPGGVPTLVVGESLLSFFGVAAVARPTGVAVTAEAIHAALVTLGLIAGP